MTSKEKKIKAFVELATIQCRIDELKRSKTWFSSSTYYRNRLRQLEEKEESLERLLEDDEEEIKLTFRLPSNLLDGKEIKTGEEIIQYLKREYLERG